MKKLIVTKNRPPCGHCGGTTFEQNPDGSSEMCANEECQIWRTIEECPCGHEYVTATRSIHLSNDFVVNVDIFYCPKCGNVDNIEETWQT